MTGSRERARERALSFGSAAGEYAAHRTGYAAGAVRWALRPVAGRAPLELLDLGAGTGKLTESLVTLPGAVVTAVDPDPRMLAELRALLPDVTALSGAAERIPLADASVDAVLVGQAWHWFDHARAVPEIARVLRPGGVLAAIWNHDDPSVGWVAGFRAVNGWIDPGGSRAAARAFPPHPDFAPAALDDSFRHTVPMTIEGVLGWFATHSRVLALEPGEREMLLERARAFLRNHPQTRSGPFDLPIVDTVIRAVRR